MNYFRPQIIAIDFPHVIRGSGPFTRLQVQISGWGRIKVTSSEKESIPFSQWIWWKAKVYELDVPKNQAITISFRNLFGHIRQQIQSPSNNLDVALVQPAVLKVGPLPQPKLSRLKTQVNGLKSVFSKSFSAKMMVPRIRILAPKMQLRQSVKQEHLSTYRFTAPPLKADINYQAIKFIPKSNKQRQKGSLK
jgi:hypothetical protein